MSLLDVVYGNECRSTHHKLALDALRLLRGEQAESWRRLFLRYYEDYLEGAKAPDTRFKDFKNHVLHVGDKFWGGAEKAATKWYERTVDNLTKQDWSEAVFCAGVLTHYYTDPLQPLHTGQSEDEGAVHRAIEWSIFKSYDQLVQRLEQRGGWPEVEAPTGDNWLAKMVRGGAEAAHPHYRPLIDQYNLAEGVKKPQAGLNDDSRDRLADLIGHAAAGVARILERAFEDSQAKPPAVRLGVMGALTSWTAPFAWVANAWGNRGERRVVRKIHKEYTRTGAVIHSLPADDRQIRQLHAEEVLKTTVEALNQKTLEDAAARRTQAKTAAPGAVDEGSAKSSSASAEKPPASAASDKPRSASNGSSNGGSTSAANDSESAKPAVISRREARRLARAVNPPAPAPTAAVSSASPAPSAAAPQSAAPQSAAPQSAAPQSAAGPPRVQIAAGTVGPPSANSPASGRDRSDAANSDAFHDAADGASRFYLSRSDDVEAAPSIGGKTAKRLARIGVGTVNDLLALDPDQGAQQLDCHYITPETIRQWQSQAALVCRIPNLRGHDAQMLVGCGMTDPASIGQMRAEDLLDRVENFLISEDGERILRRAREPDLAEVERWIAWSAESRRLSAA